MKCDWVLLGLVLMVSLIGLLAVYSSSGIYSTQRYGDAYYYLKKQTMFWAAGVGLMMLVMNLSIATLRKMTPALAIGSFLMLGFVLVHGAKVGVAQRWLVIAGVHFQPVELVKLVFCCYLAKKFSELHNAFSDNVVSWKRLLPIALVILFFTGLVLAQPDFGNASVMMMIAVVGLFVACFPIRYFVLAFLFTMPAAICAIFMSSYRMQRIFAFLNPWRDPRGSGFQIIQSFLGFSEGKLLGVGLGAGKQKMFYLPEAHTDFIFSVIGEEVGWIGISLVVLLFMALIYRMYRIAIQLSETYEKLLAFLLLGMIAIPVWLNMFVVLGLFPTKGLPLPFISSGGSSLIACFMAMGILLRLSTKVSKPDFEFKPLSPKEQSNNGAPS